MTKDNANPTAASVRRQAETRASANLAKSMDPLWPEAARQMFHELRVHQVELELQNDELRRTQAELEASRARYVDLYDLAPVGYLTLSQPGLILEANLTAAGLLGVERGALVKRPLSSFIVPEDQALYDRDRQQLFETGAPRICELRLMKTDGHTNARRPSWARLESTVTRDAEGAPACRTALSDITASKEAEGRLRESDNFSRRLMDISPDAIAVTDLEGMVVLCNQRTAAQHGFESPQALTGANVRVFFPPEEWPRAMENMRKTLTSGRVTDIPYTLLRQDGTSFPAELTATVVPDPDGNPRYLMAIIRDITAQKQAEAALRESEARLGSYFDHAPFGVFITDEFGNYLEVNPAACAITGYTMEELVRLSVPELLPPEAQAAGAQHFRQTLETGQAAGELAFRHKTGQISLTMLD